MTGGTGYRNAVVGCMKIDYVPSKAPATISFTDVIRGRAERGVFRKLVEDRDELVGITCGLLKTPSFERIQPDGFQVAYRGRR